MFLGAKVALFFESCTIFGDFYFNFMISLHLVVGFLLL